mgnify:CR=1 FL=1
MKRALISDIHGNLEALHRRQLLDHVGDRGGAGTLDLLGTDRRDGDRHVLQRFGALLRGHDDLAEVRGLLRGGGGARQGQQQLVAHDAALALRLGQDVLEVGDLGLERRQLLAIFGAELVLTPAAEAAVGTSLKDLERDHIIRTLGRFEGQKSEAARALGASDRSIIFRHIVPNTLGPVIVYTTLTIPGVMLTEAFLSFLGLGVQPPAASWGTLVSDGARVLALLAAINARPGHALHPSIDLGGMLVIRNGAIDPDASVLELVPPLRVSVRASAAIARRDSSVNAWPWRRGRTISSKGNREAYGATKRARFC